MIPEQNTSRPFMTGARWAAVGLCCGMAIIAVPLVVLSIPVIMALAFAWATVSLILFVLRGTVDPRSQPDWLASPVYFVSSGGVLLSLLLARAALVFAEGQAQAGEGALWMMCAGLVLVAALLQADTAPLCGDAVQSTPPMLIHRERLRWVPLVPGVVLMVITTEINANILSLGALQNVSSHIQFVIWVSAWVLIGFGLAGTRVIVDQDPSPRTTPRPYREWLALSGILALAVGVRLYQLRDAQRFLVDEIHFLNPVIYFWEDAYIRLLQPFSSIAAFPYLFPYLQTLSAGWVHHNLEGLRFASVVFGVLTVWAVYLLARVLFGGRVALIAAALLAVMPVHVQFSRIGINNIADPLFGTLALYFVARAWRSPKYLVGNFAWAGVMIGLTQYWYEGGRLLFPGLMIIWLTAIGLIAFGFGWRPRVYQQYQRALAVLSAGGVLVGAPIYITLFGMDRPLSQRMESAGLNESTLEQITSLRQLAVHAVSRLYESFLIHVSIPEEALYYGGDDPLLASFIVPFFIIGGIYACWLVISTGTFYLPTTRQILLQSGALLLVLWVGMTWSGNMLMARSRISARYVVAFPALVMLAALGLDVLIGLLTAWRQRWRSGVVVAALVVVIPLQMFDFFGPYMARFNQQFTEEQSGRSRNIDDAIQRAASLPAGTNVYVIDRVPLLISDLNNTLRFYRGERAAPTIRLQAVDPTGFNLAYLAALDLEQAHAFFVSPEHLAGIDLLYNSFADVYGPYFTDHPPSKATQLILYYVPPQPLQLFAE